jgi:hypothetical protein
MTTVPHRAVPMAALPRPFRTAWWARGAHAQTLAGKFLRAIEGVALRRERWETPDGDFVDLDFAPDPGGDSPLVLVLHGLEGSARRGYCVQAYRELAARGVAAVGLNFRSCSGEPNRRARGYHSGDTADAASVLERLAELHPGRPLGALGFSLGGNVLLKLMAERDDGGRGVLSGAVAISVPYDLAAAADHLERGPFGRMYTHYFLRSLLAKTRDKAHLLGELLDLDELARVRTIRAFDDLLTAPVHGFPDAATYYQLSSSGPLLAGVRVPTLLLHSMDDPFLPPAAVPTRAMGDNPHLHPVLTPRGGHVGFVTGTAPRPRFWGEEAAARFLAGTLLTD